LVGRKTGKLRELGVKKTKLWTKNPGSCLAVDGKRLDQSTTTKKACR